MQIGSEKNNVEKEKDRDLKSNERSYQDSKLE